MATTTSSSSYPNLRRAAYHEASHACLALALNMEVRRVSLKGTKDNLHGLVQGSELRGSPTADALSATVAAAGRYAEAKALGREAPSKSFREHAQATLADLEQDQQTDDRAIAEALARIGKVLGSNKLESIHQLIEQTAGQLVNQYWDSITKVASALESRGELSGTEVARLVSSPQTHPAGY